MKRYDVVAYDGAGEFSPLELAEVSRSRIAGALRELERARGVSLAFAVIYKAGESVIVGAAVRNAPGWSIRCVREG